MQTTTSSQSSDSPEEIPHDRGSHLSRRPCGPDDRVAGTSGRAATILFTLTGLQFVSFVDFMIVMPLGPQLLADVGIDAEQFIWVVAAYTLAAGLAGFLVAPWLDRVPRKSASIAFSIGLLAGTVAWGMAASYPVLLAARCVTGGFGGVLGGLAQAIVADVFPAERRGRDTGTLKLAFALASVAGSPLGIALGTSLGWQVPFCGLTALGLPLIGLAAWSLPPLGRPSRRRAAASAGPPARDAHGARPSPRSSPDRPADGRRLFGDPVHQHRPGGQCRRDRAATPDRLHRRLAAGARIARTQVAMTASRQRRPRPCVTATRSTVIIGVIAKRTSPAVSNPSGVRSWSADSMEWSGSVVRAAAARASSASRPRTAATRPTSKSASTGGVMNHATVRGNTLAAAVMPTMKLLVAAATPKGTFMTAYITGTLMNPPPTTDRPGAP